MFLETEVNDRREVIMREIAGMAALLMAVKEAIK